MKSYSVFIILLTLSFNVLASDSEERNQEHAERFGTNKFFYMTSILQGSPYNLFDKVKHDLTWENDNQWQQRFFQIIEDDGARQLFNLMIMNFANDVELNCLYVFKNEFELVLDYIEERSQKAAKFLKENENNPAVLEDCEDKKLYLQALEQLQKNEQDKFEEFKNLIEQFTDFIVNKSFITKFMLNPRYALNFFKLQLKTEISNEIVTEFLSKLEEIVNENLMDEITKYREKMYYIIQNHLMKDNQLDVQNI